jgi:hypothetical protein
MPSRQHDEKDRAVSDQPGLIEAFNQMLGGALTSFVGALVGRAMWHSGEVRAKRRRMFGPELLWELPTALGMGFVGEGASGYLGLESGSRTALIVALAYLGPRGAQALAERILGGREK